jgi:hypothetical protein
MENLKDTIEDNFSDFKMLYNSHLNEMNEAIAKIRERGINDKQGSDLSHRAIPSENPKDNDSGLKTDRA